MNENKHYLTNNGSSSSTDNRKENSNGTLADIVQEYIEQINPFIPQQNVNKILNKASFCGIVTLPKKVNNHDGIFRNLDGSISFSHDNQPISSSYLTVSSTTPNDEAMNTNKDNTLCITLSENRSTVMKSLVGDVKQHNPFECYKNVQNIMQRIIPSHYSIDNDAVDLIKNCVKSFISTVSFEANMNSQILKKKINRQL